MPDLPGLDRAPDQELPGAPLAQQCLAAYGLRFTLTVSDPFLLKPFITAAPLGWRLAPSGSVDIRYTLLAQSPGAPDYRLFCGPELVAHAPDLAPLLAVFHHHAELLTAFHARDALFVHAGVVGVGGGAVLIPGRSLSGKSSLVAALVRGGATYYSDEFAILDPSGQVHPYPVPLSLRSPEGTKRTPGATRSGTAKLEPLPVRLVVVTRYHRWARWRPQPLTPGQALLALMDNTVAAQRRPEFSMPILRQVVSNATALHSARGEAQAIARALLRRLSASA